MSKTLMRRLQAIHEDEEGAGATEYIILLILIACVIIGMVKAFGTTISSKYSNAEEYIDKDVEVESW